MSITAHSGKRIYLYLLVLACLGLTIYSNTFGHKFVWDDDFLIVKNSFIKDWRHLPDIFKSELRIFSRDVSNYYRPLQAVSYLIDYSIWRLDPLGYHLSNIIFHVIVSILVFLLIRCLCANNSIALLTGLLFLTHPLHTEVNSYVSGRADSLAGIFLLGSFILYVKQGRFPFGKIGSLYLILSVLLFIAALLSKEVVLVFPLILFIYERLNKKKASAAYLKPAIFFIITLLYASLRLTKLNFLSSHGISIFSTGDTSFLNRCLTFPKIILLYFKLLFMPSGLHLLRTTEPVTGIFTPWGLVSLSFAAALCALLFFVYRHSRIIFFYSVWFLVFLLPTLNLFPIGVSVAEHFLYLPSIGFFAAVSTISVNSVAGLPLSGKRIKILVLVLGAVILSCFSFLTYRQNGVWKDNLSLYTYLLKYVPRNYIIHNNLGSEYLKKGEYDRALEQFQKTIQLNPAYAYAYNNLGNLYQLKGNFAEAVIFYKKTIELRPGLAEPRDSLGRAYLNQGKYTEAVMEFNSALKIDPGYVASYHNLGVTSFKQGKKETAIEYYKKAIAVDKKYVPSYYNIGLIYKNEGDYKSAFEWWHKALDISPRDVFIKIALDNLKRKD